METIEERVNSFYDQWEYYYFPDRNEKSKPTVLAFMQEIDALGETIGQTKKKEKAKLLYLKAKIQDILPQYEKSSEDLLNKSIKLNPSNGDCWNTLAHVLFKKNDIEGAKKAIEMALQNKGRNKVSLRYLSVLLRSQNKNSIERRKNIEESVKIIKEALLIDMKDAGTWYFLGNAYLSNFFANFKKFDELQNAVKAYNEAEKYFQYKYPDLYLNRANVLMHMESYEAAVKDYKQFLQIDPSANIADKIDTINKRMEHTKVSFDRLDQIKSSKMQDLLKNIPNSTPNSKVQVTPSIKLTERFNVGKLISGKIIAKLTGMNDIPISYLVMDSEGNFLAVSVYNADEAIEQKIKKDTLIAVMDPQLKKVVFNGFSYNSVQVFQIMKLYVDGKQMVPSEFNPNVVVNQIFQK